MIAWQTSVLGWPESVGIVAASDRREARIQTHRSARDAGYDVSYIDVTARRAPQFDDWAEVQKKPRCLTVEAAQQELDAITREKEATTP